MWQMLCHAKGTMKWESSLKNNDGTVGAQIRNYTLQNDMYYDIFSDYGNISERRLVQAMGGEWGTSEGFLEEVTASFKL